MDRIPELPGPRERRSERFMIHLTPEVAKRLRELANARGEPPGRLATLLVEDGSRALAGAAHAGP